MIALSYTNRMQRGTCTAICGPKLIDRVFVARDICLPYCTRDTVRHDLWQHQRQGLPVLFRLCIFAVYVCRDPQLLLHGDTILPVCASVHILRAGYLSVYLFLLWSFYH